MVQAAVNATGTTGFAACRVAAVERDCEDSVTVTLLPPAGQTWTFAHGQHLVLRRNIDGTEIRRSYSLCSGAPDGPLKVAIRLVPGGAFSTWANTELAAGDTIEAMPPGGRFTHDLDPEAAKTYLLVAGGSGITPISSIAETVLAAEPGATVTLLYVNKTTASTMLLDSVEGLRNKYLGRFQLWYAFTREASAIELLDGRPDAGRIVQMIDRGLLPSRVDHAFLCGPQGLVDEVTSGLISAGVDPSRIHHELFTAGEGRLGRPAPQPVVAGAEPVAQAMITLHGKTTTVPVFEGDTVLEAAQRQRPDVPYSCRAGVCSTCMARLVEGEVTMDICHGLEPSEVEAGNVLTCRSVPTTAVVRVDYDV